MIAETKSMTSRRTWLIARFQSIFRLEGMSCRHIWKDLTESRLILEISSRLMKTLMEKLDLKKKLKHSLDRLSNHLDSTIKKAETCKSIRTKNLICTEKMTLCLTPFIWLSSKSENSSLESSKQLNVSRILKISLMILIQSWYSKIWTTPLFYLLRKHQNCARD